MTKKGYGPFSAPALSKRGRTPFSAALVLACAAGIALLAAQRLPEPLLSPDSPALNRTAPDLFRVRLDTTKGLIVIEVHRDWAPHGADRFFNLVSAGFYDDTRFFRVVKGQWAQFGINGDPEIAAVWRTRTIPDDPRKQSNVRGTVAFAFAVPNGRTTQVYIALSDLSARQDPEGFAPFGRVVEGMDVADALHSEYGERSGGGIRAGHQDPLFEGGNPYLDREFPRLEKLLHAHVERQR